MFEKIKKFVKEVKVELTKVTWPTPSELRATTTVVIITTFIMTVFIGIVDFGLAQVIGALLR
ncbi:preprotein translocase subunit SecE [Candidatus Eisenbacteria bacterium]|uniref:Protein translocase subunit SecE n=1 Tax=Eiseniibacteriota bacterium TaxID=2212470 RepID=A0ABV6YPU9_UNCEI